MPITREDIVVADKRFLYTLANGEGNNEKIVSDDQSSKDSDGRRRFFIKGIAFPNAPPLPSPPPSVGDDVPTPQVNYNVTAWIAVLEQLRQALPPAALNAVRLYQMDPSIDYSDFLYAAARLDFYVMVPLTTSYGDAVLNRLAVPPLCYPYALYQYGTQALRNYLRYPNVLAGVVGNEVMNGMEAWQSAPCIKAYTRDLKAYMKTSLLEPSFNGTTLNSRRDNMNLAERYVNRTNPQGEIVPLPLMYAAQDSGIGAALSHVDTLRLTLDYLSCTPSASNPGQANEGDKDGNSILSSSSSTSDIQTTVNAATNDSRHESTTDSSIDIFGVNVESWCASYNTFEANDDGSSGTFYRIWQGLHSALEASLVFSEIGCSHSKFNRDTPALRTPEGTREWTEIPVVLHDMADTWSGYCAYAYWGNPQFNMMKEGPWNGRDVLEPTQDFVNFQKQSILATSQSQDGAMNNSSTDPNNHADITSLDDLPMRNGGVMQRYYAKLTESDERPSCEEVERALKSTCNLNLVRMQHMPLYSSMSAVNISAMATISPSLISAVDPHNRTDAAPSLISYAMGIATLIVLGILITFFLFSKRTFQKNPSYERIP